MADWLYVSISSLKWPKKRQIQKRNNNRRKECSTHFGMMVTKPSRVKEALNGVLKERDTEIRFILQDPRNAYELEVYSIQVGRD